MHVFPVSFFPVYSGQIRAVKATKIVFFTIQNDVKRTVNIAGKRTQVKPEILTLNICSVSKKEILIEQRSRSTIRYVLKK